MVISQTHLRQESRRHDFEKNPPNFPELSFLAAPSVLAASFHQP